MRNELFVHIPITIKQFVYYSEYEINIGLKRLPDTDSGNWFIIPSVLAERIVHYNYFKLESKYKFLHSKDDIE